MRLSTLAYQHLGSANIYVLDAHDFGLRRTLSVRAGLKPLRRINELQYIRGELWANVWGDQRLAVPYPNANPGPGPGPSPSPSPDPNHNVWGDQRLAVPYPNANPGPGPGPSSSPSPDPNHNVWGDQRLAVIRLVVTRMASWLGLGLGQPQPYHSQP